MTALLSLQVSHITSQHHDPLSHCHHGKVLLLGHVINLAPHCTTLVSAEVGSSKCHCYGSREMVFTWCLALLQGDEQVLKWQVFVTVII
jgi:hypothetical protein